ncbi:hypothetical protein [Sphingomicrobium sediminis]|uniref:Uncharacterized protein n=1 Tax=Sphingomicrobium sediminis TaxID=2950949 RepID=A0A9X2EJN1_9SPHN|nr:hypothetical protein [Sphingomicrobium sediminis]MCM8556502.1 hypothetical protein [Sphingomicrobium sediminis]
MMNRHFEVPCTVSVAQSPDYFHAHVELDGDHAIFPGDKVRVHGDPISIPFGSSAEFKRTATVTRATALKRALVKAAAYFDLAELYEVSFSAGRIK